MASLSHHTGHSAIIKTLVFRNFELSFVHEANDVFPFVGPLDPSLGGSPLSDAGAPHSIVGPDFRRFSTFGRWGTLSHR
ncbi:hypothetical protein Y032_0058g2923 [Ancylostoma ceylanicum]|uniref:Uncharacterized protein n=1 Tax=Ancylostoma ceylanicum TaxID=53326 RepID=A0A016U4X0_9BILA|nr:hypothetical protein Y032_0058g2923 [Ancylostoma ceylanicum]